MKIKIEEGQDKAFLENGRHEVAITDVTEGKSEYKGTPFFSCRFENEDGYITSRFYLTDPGMAGIVSLFETVAVPIEEGAEVNTDALLKKHLSIVVRDRTYQDPDTGSERTVKEAVEFQKAGEKSRA
ncbi:MAG: hypothetical protein H7Z75_08105 [Ferruginibacter sp.]|nr:hypothetical protein [Cytophagales bacterium]